jgi:hypothetical protein
MTIDSISVFPLARKGGGVLVRTRTHPLFFQAKNSERGVCRTPYRAKPWNAKPTDTTNGEKGVHRLGCRMDVVRKNMLTQEKRMEQEVRNRAHLGHTFILTY